MNPVIRQDLFALTTIPFLKNSAKPFLDEPRQQCLLQLNKFLQFRGFAAVAGKPGTGKTALIRYFTQSLHQPAHKIIYLPFTNLNESDVLKALCQRLDTEPPFGKNAMITTIQKRIRDLQPINPIIVLDEMQNASNTVMEHIRLLANDHFDKEAKISWILVGTSQLFTKLQLAINLSLAQRICRFFQLRELSKEDTDHYISHCLEQAGAKHTIFEPAAINFIADASKGIMRIINQLAGSAMAIASENQSSNVSIQYVHQAADLCILPQGEVSP